MQPAPAPLNISFDPSGTYQGILPNGKAFAWQLVHREHIPLILKLQDQVAHAANDLEKTFLIVRSTDCFNESIDQGHLYWGALVDGQLVGLFGLADNDEEVGDGRGDKTAKEDLGVDDYTHVSILKGAQIHPDYRDQGLAAMGALSRYLYFTANPDKRVIMTKIHGNNINTVTNYLNNGFTEASRTAITDRGHTFDVVAYKAEREIIEDWLKKKTSFLRERFSVKNI
jgi:GNAT superfamily N-acetyltransferase